MCKYLRKAVILILTIFSQNQHRGIVRDLVMFDLVCIVQPAGQVFSVVVSLVARTFFQCEVRTARSSNHCWLNSSVVQFCAGHFKRCSFLLKGVGARFQLFFYQYH